MIALTERLKIGLVPREVESNIYDFCEERKYWEIIKRGLSEVIEVAGIPKSEFPSWHHPEGVPKVGGFILKNEGRLGSIVTPEFVVPDFRIVNRTSVFCEKDDFIYAPLITLSFDVQFEKSREVLKTVINNYFFFAFSDDEEDCVGDSYFSIKIAAKKKCGEKVTEHLGALKGLFSEKTSVEAVYLSRGVITKRQYST